MCQMNQYIIILLLAIGLSVLFWLLYNAGYLIFSSKRAITFIATKRGKNASFTACTGYVKRIIRFRCEGTVNFSFSCTLTKGDVWVEVFDSDKNLLLRLDCTTPNGSISVKSNQRCSLVFHFSKATGEYSLSWK